MIKRLLVILLSKVGLLSAMQKALLWIHGEIYLLAGMIAIELDEGRLHPKHRITRYHEWFVKQIDPSWRVLDIGCGNGALAHDLAAHCREVVGIEINEKKVEAARRRNPSIKFICADATKLPIKEKYDAVILSNVLEHIEHRVEFLRKISLLADNILIRVPMIERDWLAVYKKEIGIEYRLDSTHFTEYRAGELEEELSKAGLIAISSPHISFGELFLKARTAKSVG